MIVSAPTTVKRNVALSIGVAEVDRFPYLAGAVNAAKAFHGWAKALGYESRLVTDERNPVTFSRLRFELESALAGPMPTAFKEGDDRRSIEQALAEAQPIGRLIVFFAGHGLIKETEQGSWFLSNSMSELRVVDVEHLRRRLFQFDLDQIAIISDACSSLPTTAETADLDTDPILGRGPRAPIEPPVDKFIAAQDGEQSFSIPGESPDEDRTIFSSVLVEALWGSKKEAFISPESKFVTSQSLRTYLMAEVPRIAAKYKRTLRPRIYPNFAPGNDIYFGNSAILGEAPTFLDWPSPSAVIGMGAAVGPAASELTDAKDIALGSPIAIEGLPNAVGRHRQSMRQSRSKSGLRPPLHPGRAGQRSPNGRGGTAAAKIEVATLAKLRAQDRPQSFETGAGFAVSGVRISSVLTEAGIVSGDIGRENWVHIGARRADENSRKIVELDTPSPVLLKTAEGLTAAVTAIPEMITTIAMDARGAYALVCRPRGRAQERLATEDAIAKLESGLFGGADLTQLLVSIRNQKHFDPTLGAISAYVYESLGDIDSIRQMAYYYAARRQPIPFDIAMLANLDTQKIDGHLIASVPATKSRRARNEIERRHTWMFRSTPEKSGIVGGVWPWMRQGWPLLEDFYDERSGLIDPVLIEIASTLAPARFSTVSAAGGAALAEHFGLSVRHSHEP